MKRDILKGISDAEKKEIVNRIIYLRKDCFHMTQPEFAKRLGYSQTYVSLVEQGKRELSGDYVAAILNELIHSEDWLLYGEGMPFNKAVLSEVIPMLRTTYNLSSEDEKYLKWYLSQTPDAKSCINRLSDTALELHRILDSCQNNPGQEDQTP